MRNNIVRYICALLLAALLCASLAGCAPTGSTGADVDGITVVATLFPQYDMARYIVGDKGSVTMLLQPGTESHSFDPTPADLVSINSADLFIYTGRYMETWSGALIDSLEGSVTVVDASAGIELYAATDEHDGHEGHSHTDEQGRDVDPHIWTSPVNAAVMVRTVLAAITAADPDNAGYYAANAEEYIAALDDIDATLRTVADSADGRALVFGGRFAFGYLCREYGFDHVCPYDSCSEDTEPSAQAVSAVIAYVNEHSVPVVFYEELTTPTVAQTVSDETGAALMLLHSGHNVSRDDMGSGVTFLDIMRANASAIAEALK